MKKIILATLFLFFGSITTTQAFDGGFLDEIQVKIFLNEKLTARDAQKVLRLSSEAPQVEILLENKESEEAVVSSEDPTEQKIKEPTYSKIRRDFSFIKAPKKETTETLLEVSSRQFPSSLEIVRERQRRARAKALRYRITFRKQEN